MTIDPLKNVRTVVLDTEVIELDPKFLQFNDATINKFIEAVSLYYDYYSSKCAMAESLLANAELDYETKYMQKFAEAKSEGISDKGADAMTKVNEEVIASQKKVIDTKTAHRQIKEYLRAFDKAHEMAKNRGYMLCKEMDKLSNDIYYSNTSNKKEIDVSDILNP